MSLYEISYDQCSYSKAISPLIASVLLVAFAVAVGITVSSSLSTISKTQTSALESLSREATNCLGVNLEIKKVVIDSTTDEVKVSVFNEDPPLKIAAVSDIDGNTYESSIEEVKTGIFHTLRIPNAYVNCFTFDELRIGTSCKGISYSVEDVDEIYFNDKKMQY